MLKNRLNFKLFISLTLTLTSASLVSTNIMADNLLLAYSLEQSINDAKQSTNGKVLSAETKQLNNRSIHHIRVLTESGKVKRFQYDKNSGQRLKKSFRQR